ncbi:MAG: hypothetical protein NUV77_18860 [Thermoguttaceae bacterium]|nr:hypothetical protein [Thermoguttaceae bacterium]
MPVSPTRWAQGPVNESDRHASRGTPHVLARIPSLAAEESLDDEDNARLDRRSKRFGRGFSLKVLAVSGCLLFLAALLWGFVFDKNEKPNPAGSSTAVTEPFRPQPPAPNAPVAPRWGGSSADPTSWQAGTAAGNSSDANPYQFGGAGPAEPEYPSGRPTWAAGPSQPGSTSLPVQAGGPNRYGEQRETPPFDETPDWTTQPYPNTANRSTAPSWRTGQDVTAPTGTPTVARRETVRDFTPASPLPANGNGNTAFPAGSEPRQAGPGDYRALPDWAVPQDGRDLTMPSGLGQPAGSSSNRPASLAERAPIEAPAARGDGRSEYRAAPRPEFRSPYAEPDRPAYQGTPSSGSYPGPGAPPSARPTWTGSGSTNPLPNYRPAPSGPASYQGLPEGQAVPPSVTWPSTSSATAWPTDRGAPMPGSRPSEYGTGPAATPSAYDAQTPASGAAAARFDQTIQKAPSQPPRYEPPAAWQY